MIRLTGCEIQVGDEKVAPAGDSPRSQNARRPVLYVEHLEIHAGEYIGVVGANGAGKSIFLQALAGLWPPETGKIIFDSPHDSLSVALVFQSPDNQIVGGTTALDLAFGLECRAEPSERIRAAVAESLRSFDLERMSKRPPHLLSEGEKQRLALASSMVVQPSLLLLDEPTSRLDPDARADFLGRLERMRGGSSLTVVHVTHRSNEFMKANRILGLHEGRIAFDGPPAEFLAHADSDRFQPIWSPLHRFRRRLIFEGIVIGPPPAGRWNDVDALLQELVSR